MVCFRRYRCRAISECENVMTEEHSTPLPEKREFHKPVEGQEFSQPANEESPHDTGGMRLQVVVVAVHDAFYGIRIGTVREILRVPKITWVPWTPEYIVGIINVRGEMLSIVDLRVFFHYAASQFADTNRIVVVEARELAAGLLVDEMVDILDVPIVTFQSIPAETDHLEQQHYLAGHFRWRGMTLALLDSDLLLQGTVVNQG